MKLIYKIRLICSVVIVLAFLTLTTQDLAVGGGADICQGEVVVKNPRGDLAFGVMREPPPGPSPSVWLGVYPGAIVVDSIGNIHVADQVKYRILRFDKHGKFLLKFGLQSAIKSKIGVTHLIPAMAVDGKDRLYVVNEDQGRIEIYRKDGEYINSIDYSDDKISHVRADLYKKGYRPDRISIDTLGNIYLYDSFNSGGGVYSPEGKLLRIGIKVDAQGRGVVNYDETNMVGFSGYYYSLPYDEFIIRDKEGRLIKSCPVNNVRVLEAERGVVYTTDRMGNIYLFDYKTLDIIKILPWG